MSILKLTNHWKNAAKDLAKGASIENRMKVEANQEEIALKHFHNEINQDFRELFSLIVNFKKLFEKGTYSKTEVKPLLDKFKKIIEGLNMLYDASKLYKEAKHIAKFGNYCKLLRDNLKSLSEKIEKNEIQFGVAAPRKIKDSTDILFAMDEILKKANQELESTLREKYALYFNFEERLKKVA